jgi:hypothetical protein
MALLQVAPTSLVLFHCLFDNYGIASHRSYSFAPESYIELPDLYGVGALCWPTSMVGSLSFVPTSLADAAHA